MKQRVLVTGGAGFIGSAVVRHLISQTECNVLTLDKLTYAGHLASLGEAHQHPRHEFVEGDVADESLVNSVFKSFQPEWVMHLAAESHVDRSIEGPRAFVESNVLGTATLLDASLHHWRALPDDRRDGFRFLQVSTDEVFGSLGEQGRFHAESPYRPNSPYSASKAAADHLVRAWHRTYGLPVLTTHCSNNYGPYQYPEKLIPLMIHNGVAGLPLPVYGTGNQVRDWLHVEDHVAALIAVLQRGRPGRTYCIGAETELCNLELIQRLCAYLDSLRPDSGHVPHASLIRHVTDRPGHDQRYAIDNTTIREEIGWTPYRSLEDGLRETAQWYLDNGDWVRTVLPTRSETDCSS